MRRGTTPTHTFEIPISPDDIKEIEITYQQNRKNILQKYKSDCVLGENLVSVTLTQEETFLFSENEIVKIQIRFLDKYGNIYPTPVFRVSCEECLSEEVLS